MNKKDIDITDELLESLGFEKFNITFNNRDDLFKEYRKNKERINREIKWNNTSFLNSEALFKLDDRRFIQKIISNDYLLTMYDAIPENDNTFTIYGPMWITAIRTINELESLLTVLHIGYNKEELDKYVKKFHGSKEKMEARQKTENIFIKEANKILRDPNRANKAAIASELLRKANEIHNDPNFEPARFIKVNI